MRLLVTAMQTERQAVQRRALAEKAAEAAALRILQAQAVARMTARELLRLGARRPRRRT